MNVIYSLFHDYSQAHNHNLYFISTLNYQFKLIHKRKVFLMIVYTPFWETLKNSNESTYTLINKHHISASTIQKLRENKPLNTTTINDLCIILGCDIQGIAQYVHSDMDQRL